MAKCNVKKEVKNVCSINKLENLAYCFLCDTMKQIHQYSNIENKISSLCTKVNQWNTQGSSQIRSINSFKCLICNFDTNKFKSWVKHIMSINHVSNCHNVKNIHSFPCGACKILYYGSNTLINQHRYDIHNDKSNLPCVLKLMANIIKCPYTSHLYFCSQCKTFKNKPSHKFDNTHHKNQVLYFCEYCNITFLCSTEVLDNHSLSVEHVTLKCIFFLKKLYKFNIQVNKLETHISNTQDTEEHDNNLDPYYNPLKLSLIILDTFVNTSQFMVKCQLCNIVINQNVEEILDHTIYKCTNKSYLSSKMHKTVIETYDCRICNYTTRSFSNYKIHIISPMHIINYHNVSNIYSYYCTICNLYMYSSKWLIKMHWESHNKTYHGLPYISTFLADNFEHIRNHPDDKFIDYFVEVGQSTVNPRYEEKCYVCKINFNMCVNDYNLHKISSEHIILKYFSRKLLLFPIKNIEKDIEEPSNSEYESSAKNNMILQELQANECLKENDELCGKNEDFPPENDYANKIESIIDGSEIENAHRNIFDSEKVKKRSKLKSITNGSLINAAQGTINTDHNISTSYDNLGFENLTINSIKNSTIQQESFNDNTGNIPQNWDKQLKTVDIDELYGLYVTHRLSEIQDITVKCNIKLQISNLFYTKINELTKKSTDNFKK